MTDASSSDRPTSSGRRRRRTARRRGRGRRQRRVVLEHAPLERAQLGGGLEAELVERAAGVAVRGERVRVAPRAVEGEDQLCLESLAVRVRCDEPLELADERRVPARGEIVVDAGFERGEPALVEPCRGRQREGLVREVGERGTAPERERLVRLPLPSSSCSKRSTSSSPGSTRTR